MIQEELLQEDFHLNIEEMVKAGLHFGHRASKLHPKMRIFVSGVRNGINIIDLEKSLPKFKEALFFMRDLVVQGKIILFVGTKIQHKDLVQKTATECGFPYVVERWLGGLFTNFEVMKKRVDYLKELQAKKESEGFTEYTKKERMETEKEIRNLEIKFGGIKNLEKLPDVIFVVDVKKDELAVKEAKRKGIKVVGVTDTNVDPSLVDYPIPANDEAISSAGYILEKVKETILKAKNQVISANLTVNNANNQEN